MSFRILPLQEMIKYGELFQGIFVSSLSHNKNDVDYFIDVFDKTCFL